MVPKFGGKSNTNGLTTAGRHLGVEVTRPGVINPAGIRAAYLPLNDGSSILLGRSKIRPTGTTKGLDEKEMCERPAVKGPFVAESNFLR
jgi:hypothetical protein